MTCSKCYETRRKLLEAIGFNNEPDYPPRVRASDGAVGDERYGPTGQLWRKEPGNRWVRVVTGT